jgi:hypothetical protein
MPPIKNLMYYLEYPVYRRRDDRNSTGVSLETLQGEFVERIIDRGDGKAVPYRPLEVFSW